MSHHENELSSRAVVSFFVSKLPASSCFDCFPSHLEFPMSKVKILTLGALFALVSLVNLSSSNLNDQTCSVRKSNEEMSEDLYISEGGW